MPRVRVSIAGLMGVVLVVALGLMAMRSGSYTWASAVLLLTCGLLSLGIVGMACGGTGERAWWVGFCVFGWGYLATTLWPHSPYFGGEGSPPLVLLQSLMVALGVHWPAIFAGFGEDWASPPPFAIVAHSFWSLLCRPPRRNAVPFPLRPTDRLIDSSR